MLSRLQMTVLILALPFLNACTREKLENSRLSLSLPAAVGPGTSSKLAAQGLSTTALLSHVSLSATWSGNAAPISQIWDANGSTSAAAAAPTAWELELPAGTGRLIQLLAAYEDPSTQQMVFYYGDATVDLKTATLTLDLPLKQLNSATVTQGHVFGRYLTSATSGPTGLVDIKYAPPGGKPAMLVQTATIASGWFNFFMLSGSQAQFQYQLRETGEVLWGGPVDLTSAIFNPSVDSETFMRRARAFIPVHLRKRNENNTTRWENEAARTFVWGYWGPDASVQSKRVCTTGINSGPIVNLGRFASPVPAGGPSALSYTRLSRTATSLPTAAQLTDTTNPLSTISFQGGGSTDMTDTCGSFTSNAANLYENFLKVRGALIDGQGEDVAGSFRGLYRIPDQANGGSGFASVAMSQAQTKQITATLLPGVAAAIETVRAFKKPMSPSQWLNNPDCTLIQSQGFVPAGPPATISGGALSLDTGITASEASAGVGVVLCPVKNGQLQKWGGEFISASAFSGQMGSSGPYLRVSFMGAGYGPSNTDVTILTKGHCFPVAAELFVGFGDPSPNTSGSPLSVNVAQIQSLGYGTFYPSNMDTCEGVPPAISELVIQPNQSSSPGYFFKPGNLLSIAQPLPVTISSPGYSFTQSIEIHNPTIELMAIDKIIPDQCYPGHARLTVDPGVSPYATSYNDFVSPIEVNLGQGGSSALTISDNGSCSDGATTKTLTFPSTPEQDFSYKAGVGSSGNLGLTASATGFTSAMKSVTIFNSALKVEGYRVTPVVTPVPPGTCMPAKVELLNGDGATIPAPRDVELELQLTSGNGRIYDDNQCTSPVGAKTFYQGSLSETVYLRMTTPNSVAQITVPDIDISGPGGGNISIPVGADGSWGDYLYATPPNFNGKTIIGDFEFTTGANDWILVPMHYPGGTTLECSDDDVTYDNCSSRMDGTSFRLPRTTALNFEPVFFRYTRNGTEVRYVLDPFEYLGDSVIYPCAQVLPATAGASLTLSELGTAFTALGSTASICIRPGTTITKQGSEVLTLSGSQALIGSIAGTSHIDVHSQAGDAIKTAIRVTGSDVAVRIANMTLTGIQGLSTTISTSNAAGISVESIAGAASDIVIDGNRFDSSSFGSGLVVRGIATGNSVTVAHNQFVVHNTDATAGGIGILHMDSPSGSTVSYESNIFFADTNGAATSAKGIYVTNDATEVAGVSISRNSWGGVGTAITIKSGNSRTISDVFVESNRCVLAAFDPSTTQTSSCLSIDSANVNFVKSNLFEVAMPSNGHTGPLVSILSSSGATSIDDLSSNIFRSSTNASLLKIDGNSGGVTLWGFYRNQFVQKIASPAASAIAIVAGGITDISGDGDVGVPAEHGDNLFCADNATRLWATVMAAANSDGSFVPAAADAHCRQTVVSPAGQCMSFCTPL